MIKEVVLVQPSEGMIEAIEAYKQAFDNPSHIPGSSDLMNAPSISAWLVELALAKEVSMLSRTDRVPSHQYVLLRQDNQQVIGMLAIRTALNDYLLNYGGHIGYSILPLERKKGYGSAMLKEALEQAKALGLTRVLVTCDDDNLASAGVIENNLGILEDKRFEEETQKWVRRYWLRTV